VALDSGIFHVVWDVLLAAVGAAACNPDWADAATVGDVDDPVPHAEAMSREAVAGVD
jgi:hypothetical protein